MGDGAVEPAASSSPVKQRKLGDKRSEKLRTQASPQTVACERSSRWLELAFIFFSFFFVFVKFFS